MTSARIPNSTRLAAAFAAALALAACEPAPNAPAPRATVHRTVTAVVRTEAAAPAPGADVTWTAQFDSAGIADVRRASTDEDGESREVLAEGGWRVVAALGPLAAGASLVVSGPQRDAADTQLVRLTLREASRLVGTVTLAGRLDHSGTVVSAQTGDTARTNAAGEWALDGVPLGRWTVTAHHPAFRTGVALVQVTAPGALVNVPPMQLLSEP